MGGIGQSNGSQGNFGTDGLSGADGGTGMFGSSGVMGMAGDTGLASSLQITPVPEAGGPYVMGLASLVSGLAAWCLQRRSARVATGSGKR